MRSKYGEERETCAVSQLGEPSDAGTVCIVCIYT
jgi:hypothetical protein